jgi:hypothetical protein
MSGKRATRSAGTDGLIVPDPKAKKPKPSVAEPAPVPKKAVSPGVIAAFAKGLPCESEHEEEQGISGRKCTAQSKSRLLRKHREQFINIAETSYVVQFALRNEAGLQQVCERRITSVNYSKVVLLLISNNASIGAGRFFDEFTDEQDFQLDTKQKFLEIELSLAQMYRKNAAVVSGFVQKLTNDSRSFEEKLSVLHTFFFKAGSVSTEDLLLFHPVRRICFCVVSQSDCCVFLVSLLPGPPRLRCD